MSDRRENRNEERKLFFTLEEANELIPLFEQKVILLQEIKQKYDIKTLQLYDLKRVKASKKERAFERKDVFFMLEVEIEFMHIEIQSIMRFIEHRGAILRDIEMGLIDFPAQKEGKEIVFCWKLGEKQIEFYHGVNEGYYHRKPIN